MYKTLFSGVCWLIYLGSFAIQNLNYKLTVIEDEDVPLSPVGSGGTRFLPITLSLMVAIMLCTLVSIYYFRCRQYQKRILELDEDGMKSYSGWNLKKLKEAILEMEMEKVEDKIG